ncbi:NblA/ycf18 family protein [Pleurocapsa sp. PCC 7319]|uniref:NblA/ycf18 family protein n=1 Tax=Pleurocapsa sp. PCC 7319 TaxID=118161 RepID=UPI0003474371|nr:NblA/ycf18 family protein [Pleurocapsa sp. PCC 7319]
MNLESNQLSLEQEFLHEVFVTKVQNLSYEETKDLLIKFHKHTLFKENYYQKLFRNKEKKMSVNY